MLTFYYSYYTSTVYPGAYGQFIATEVGNLRVTYIACKSSVLRLYCSNSKTFKTALEASFIHSKRKVKVLLCMPCRHVGSGSRAPFITLELDRNKY